VTAEREVASLSGLDIGKTITIRDGGAVYTGSLRFVHHDKATFSTSPQKVFLRIDSGDKWHHMAHYPADLMVEVEPTS